MPTTTSAFLNVRNIEKSLAFYKALGFKVTNETKRDGTTYYADLAFRGAELGLGNIETSDDPEFRKWVATPLGAGVVLYFTTTGVDAIHDAAVKAAALIESPPTDRPYGRSFMLNDPDGYTITFLQESKPTKKPAARKAPAKARRAGAAKKNAKVTRGRAKK